jgi:hypothetical protein
VTVGISVGSEKCFGAEGAVVKAYEKLGKLTNLNTTAAKPQNITLGAL